MALSKFCRYNKLQVENGIWGFDHQPNPTSWHSVYNSIHFLLLGSRSTQDGRTHFPWRPNKPKIKIEYIASQSDCEESDHFVQCYSSLHDWITIVFVHAVINLLAIILFTSLTSHIIRVLSPTRAWSWLSQYAITFSSYLLFVKVCTKSPIFQSSSLHSFNN